MPMPNLFNQFMSGYTPQAAYPSYQQPQPQPQLGSSNSKASCAGYVLKYEEIK